MPKANGLRVIPKFATSFGHTTFSIFFKAVYRYLLLDSYFGNGDAIPWHTPAPLHNSAKQCNRAHSSFPSSLLLLCSRARVYSELCTYTILKTAVECYYKTSTKFWRIEYYNLFFSSNWCDKKVVVSMFWSILPNLVRLSYCHYGFFWLNFLVVIVFFLSATELGWASYLACVFF